MKTKKLIFGVGINDADYKVYREAVVSGKMKYVWRCPYYQTWKHMLSRCYSERYLSKYPTYAGCSVSPEWHLFSNFKKWMKQQDWEGKHLDKDILLNGNRIYSSETCAFVSGGLNKFLTDRSASRGDLPIGVIFRKDSGMFRGRCNNPFTGKLEHLGNFDNQKDAHQAWRKRKHELACQYADMQQNKRVSKALRLRFSEPLSESAP